MRRILITAVGLLLTFVSNRVSAQDESSFEPYGAPLRECTKRGVRTGDPLLGCPGTYPTNSVVDCIRGTCVATCADGYTNVGGECVQVCRTVNSVQWCYSPTPQGCETLCGDLGKRLLNEAAWFAAQDTTAECQAIATAFGYTSSNVGAYAYACVEIDPSSLVVCSSSSDCPAQHTSSFDTTHGQLCPCLR